MRFLVGFPFALIFLAVPLRAQDQPVHMIPELPLCFPLTVGGRNNKDVTVKYPVMINPTTTIRPGMVLRTLYVLGQNSNGQMDSTFVHGGSLEQSFARTSPGLESNPDNKMDPNLRHEIDNYRKTVWQVPNNFILAMAQYPTDQMHLLYSPNGRDDNIKDERFFFFDGLFVGVPDGKLRVIAVEKHSYADEAGIKAGDEIVAVGGIPTHDDPTTFANAYSTAKETAKDNEADSYPMTIVSSSGTKTASVPLPPKIKGGLMDGFFDKPDDGKKKPAP